MTPTYIISLANLESIVNRELYHLDIWPKQNKLSLTIFETNYMNINKNSQKWQILNLQYQSIVQN